MKIKDSIVTFVVATLWITSPLNAQDATSDLLGRINQLRGSLGLHNYQLNAALSVAAHNQAVWMAATGQISHTQPDGSTPRTRAAAAGYTSSAVSENIYMGSNAVAGSAWRWWLNSPIHYRGITNSTYTEVGIGTSGGAYGTAFVLVFGNPNGYVPPANIASNSGSGSGAAAPPSFIVGVDNLGNIMHEIQPGQTLGEIALIYGYTWDDLNYIRDINGMTEAEGRQLEIGAVMLIPPYGGTYTPTPGNTPAKSTLIPGINTSTSNGGILATAPPSPSPYESPVIILPSLISDGIVVATAAEIPDWLEQTIVSESATDFVPLQTPPIISTVTPENTPSANNALITADSSGTQSHNTELQTGFVDEPSAQTPALLIIAVTLQITLLSIAGFEFFRRRQ